MPYMKPIRGIFVGLSIAAVVAIFLGSPVVTLADDADKGPELAENEDSSKETRKKDEETKPGNEGNKKEKSLSHTERTAKAWAALDKKSYKAAIAAAEQCIRDHEIGVATLQRMITDKKEKVPVGAVSDKLKQEIHGFGVLNDVATCHFIQAKAYEELDDRKKAIAAYKSASRLTHARAWDPKGWFWSPSEAANKRLENLLPPEEE